MMSDPLMPQWDELTCQITARATLNAIFIGLLRVKVTISDGEVGQLFDMADQQLPELTGVAGANLLASVKIAAEQIQAE